MRISTFVNGSARRAVILAHLAIRVIHFSRCNLSHMDPTGHVYVYMCVCVCVCNTVTIIVPKR